MKLEPDFAFLFDLRIGEVDDAEPVEERDGAIADRGDGDFVPGFVALIADRLDEFVVGSEPSATGLTGSACGVPDTGFFTVSGDLVLASAEEPRGVDFMSAEVERGVHAAAEDVIDLRHEIGIRDVGDDETVARLRVVMLTDEDAFVREGPAVRFGREGVRVDDLPAFVALDEEGFPFGDAEVLNADVLPADRALVALMNLEPDDPGEGVVIEDISDGDAVDPSAERRTDRLNF